MVACIRTETAMTRSYFIVMIDYGRKGREAIVDPEITRREVVSRIQSGAYRNISSIDWVHDGVAEDVTDELMNAALVAQLSDRPLTRQQHTDELLAEHQATRR
jgi:hypothetical protein